MKGWSLEVAALATSLTVVSAARADWPMPRHDVRRSALATGVSNINKPAAFWRFKVGGTIDPAGVVARDVDGDGIPEVLFVSGGRAVARNPQTNDIVWQSPNVDAVQLVGVANLDNVGMEELVVRSSRQVFVIALQDGSVSWRQPRDDMGTIGQVRVFDMNGDGADDLVIQECGCCSVNSGNAGFAYRFYGAGASTAHPLVMWELPAINCASSYSSTVVRMRSPELSEFLNGENHRLQLVAGETGAIVGDTGIIEGASHLSQCRGIDVDFDGGVEELICVRKFPGGAAGTNHAAYLMRLIGGELVIDWWTPVGSVDGGVDIPPGHIADLDGDGAYEVTLQGRLSAGTPITVVLDALSGAERGTIIGHRPRGTYDAGSSGRYAITEANGALHAWSLTAQGLTLKWSLAGRTPLSTVNASLKRFTQLNHELISIDFDGNGSRELVTTSEAGDDLKAHDSTGGTPSVVKAYDAPKGSAVVAGWPLALPAFDSRITIAQSDGNLHVLDSSWNPITGNKNVGAYFGGYYAPGTFRWLMRTPVIGLLEAGGAPVLLAQTSRGAVQRVDAREATFSSAAKVIWERQYTSSPAIVPAVDGHPFQILGIDTENGAAHRVVALTAEGNTVWSRAFEGTVLTDLLWGNMDGSGAVDVHVTWGSPDDTYERHTVLSGDTGEALWDAPPYGPSNRQPSGGAVADWNGDGFDDVIYHAEGTWIRDGRTGNVLAFTQAQPAFSYFTPIVADVDGDGRPDLTMTASFVPNGTLDHDLQAIWIGEELDRAMNYGVIIRCGGTAPLLVTTSWEYPSRLKITETAGPGAGSFETIALANGAAYESFEAAMKAEAFGGQLASPVAHENLSGDKRVTVVVGSTDGWLYALDPCTNTMKWSLELGSSVGSVIFGDTDGDGIDELLASVGDGHLYAIKNAPLSAPEDVIDTDPPQGIVDHDVDEIETRDTLHLAWQPVAGAERYEVAFIRDPIDGGGFVTAAPWIDVGNTTSATVDGLTLVVGRRYFAAVRAVGTHEGVAVRSPDVLSDGVRVRAQSLDANPTPEASREPVWLVGRSCVYFCSVDRRGDDMGWWWMSAVGFGLLVRRRRAERKVQP